MTENMASRATIGALGEQLAVEYLTAQGWRVLARNWRCRYGELDVIATRSRGCRGVRRGQDAHH
jgi:putative endonuclease